MRTKSFTGASRRSFLRTGTGTAIGVASPLGFNLALGSAAQAQTASDYRALVCVSLGGGNDHLNTVVPYDTGSHASYKAKRGALAIERATLLPISATSAQGGRTAALNPALAGIKSIYDAGRCAVVAGVGPLLRPTTRADIDAGRADLPPLIGSHNDQAASWFSLATSGSFGWGGRIGDLLATANRKPSFTTISANGGYSLFLVGSNSSFFTVGDGGAPNLFFDAGSPLDTVITGSSRRANLLEQAYSQVHETLLAGAGDLGAAILPEDGGGLFGAPPNQNSLANQLRTVARMIGGRAALGVKRQLFFVDLGGFDTHGAQLSRHAALMSQLNDALVYFDGLLGKLGVRDGVTLFTESEFGRTYNYNGDGTDHGWGSHHLVMGGAVKGQNIFGNLPNMDATGPDFMNGSAMIPGLSVEQYGATLAKWMGVSDAGIDSIFPALGNFASRDLGFLRA